MTKDEIISIANEAGFPILGHEKLHISVHPKWTQQDFQMRIERFAELVADAEREACAKVVESCAWPSWAEDGDHREVFADAIRSR